MQGYGISLAGLCRQENKSVPVVILARIAVGMTWIEKAETVLSNKSVPFLAEIGWIGTRHLLTCFSRGLQCAV